MKQRKKKLIGFTGTSRRTTKGQLATFSLILHRYPPSEFHHGDCIESDEKAQALAYALGWKRCVHPPEDSKLRAFCKADDMFAELPYLERNHAIVDVTEMLIAMPGEFLPVLRSGTWATIRYAVSLNRPIRIIVPNGAIISKWSGKW